MNAWELIDGDNTLLTTFDLNEESIVIDAGGYMGDWSAKIIEKYNPYITIYEPVKEFYDKICERFKDNPKIDILDKALWSKKTELVYGINKSDSGLYCDSNSERVQTVDVAFQLVEDVIDLMKLNIEGSEYEVLDRIMSVKCIDKINNLLIQFHDLSTEHIIRYELMRGYLSRTHELIFSFPYIWEHWRIKQ